MIIETNGLRVDLTAAAWTRSTRCDNSGPNCVEVAYIKATASSESWNCVEVGTCRCGAEPVVAVRDSKNPTGPVLTFTAEEWWAFLAGAKAGEFDLEVGG